MRGADKLLEKVQDKPLIAHICAQAAATDAPVFVTLPDATHPRAKALQEQQVTPVFVPDADLGMAISLRRGVSALPADISHVAIVPADMPDLTTDDFDLLIAKVKTTAADRIVQAASTAGRPGHPVVFPRTYFPEIASLSGDSGAKRILQTHAECVVFVALPEEHAITDLDTPEAWADWRANPPKA